MMECWNADPKTRPSFKDVLIKLETYYNNFLEKRAQKKNKNKNNNSSQLTPATTTTQYGVDQYMHTPMAIVAKESSSDSDESSSSSSSSEEEGERSPKDKRQRPEDINNYENTTPLTPTNNPSVPIPHALKGTKKNNNRIGGGLIPL